MTFDALALSAVRDELNELLTGGRVQRIVRPSDLALGLEIYAGTRHQLLLSAESQSPAVVLVDDKLRRGTEAPSPLQLLLRKYVRGARLVGVEQPPLERILRLKLSGVDGPVELVCEIMGPLSNIILLGPDGIIMDAIKRIPSTINRYRTILPKQIYVPPPPQKKEHPQSLTPELLRGLLQRATQGLMWRRLLSTVSGISPLLAREIVYRATGEVEPPSPLDGDAYERLVTIIADMMRFPETRDWTPSVGFEVEGDDRYPVAFAPYELTHFCYREACASISDAINRVRAARRPFDAHRQVRARLHGLIDGLISRQQARLASLQRSLVPEDEIEELKIRGNAILAVAWRIVPGQSELVVDLEELGLQSGAIGGEMRIPLVATLSPAANAQKLFRDYRRRKAASAQVPALIGETHLELAYLRQLETDVDLAEDRAQLDDAERELLDGGYVTQRKKAGGGSVVSSPIHVVASDRTVILVGRNSRQNDEVTFRRGAPDDIWLHAHAVPGSHVIIKSGGASVGSETLKVAARLAAYYSASRRDTRVQVDYTQRRHVRSIKGARPGMVTCRHEQTLVVDPASAAPVDDPADG